MFDWKEYLTVAEDLAAGRAPTASEEARARAAVSRAYYAVFCRARDYLVDCQEISPRRQDEAQLHREVSERLKLSVDGRRRDLGTRLAVLRAARNRCDYEAEVRDVQKLEAEALVSARHAFARLDALLR